MTLKEFQQKDFELQQELASYENHARDLECQIAFDNKEMTRINYERCALRNEYAMSQDL